MTQTLRVLPARICIADEKRDDRPVSSTPRTIEYRLIEMPPPERQKRRGWKSEDVAAILDMLSVGWAAEIAVAEGPMRDHIYRYRRSRGKQYRFVVRRPKPGWSRVWRIA